MNDSLAGDGRVQAYSRSGEAKETSVIIASPNTQHTYGFMGLVVTVKHL